MILVVILNDICNWYESEQPNEIVISKFRSTHNKVDIILSHTWPYKYLPREMFLEGIDLSTLDNSTEYFLDKSAQKRLYIFL